MNARIRYPASSAVVFAAILWFFVTGTGCKRGKLEPQSGVNRLLKGQYLREDYIRALCQTLSPLRATQPGEDPQLIVVDRKQQDAFFMQVHNFHEGGEVFRATKNGKLLQDGPDGRAVDTGFALTVHDQKSFSLSRGDRRFRFRFVDDAERWLSDALVAGTYRDAKGAPYVFDRNGHAKFPGARSFSYTLGIDHVLTNYDYLYSADLKKSWAASITRQGISLSEVSGEVDEIIAPTPRWVLTRLTPLVCE